MNKISYLNIKLHQDNNFHCICDEKLSTLHIDTESEHIKIYCNKCKSHISFEVSFNNMTYTLQYFFCQIHDIFPEIFEDTYNKTGHIPYINSVKNELSIDILYKNTKIFKIII